MCVCVCVLLQSHKLEQVSDEEIMEVNQYPGLVLTSTLSGNMVRLQTVYSALHNGHLSPGRLDSS